MTPTPDPPAQASAERMVIVPESTLRAAGWRTLREWHEEGAGYGLAEFFFSMNGINPDEWVPPAQPAPAPSEGAAEVLEAVAQYAEVTREYHAVDQQMLRRSDKGSDAFARLLAKRDALGFKMDEALDPIQALDPAQLRSLLRTLPPTPGPAQAPASAELEALAARWLREAEEEPEGSPSESVLIYCADSLRSLLATPPAAPGASDMERFHEDGQSEAALEAQVGVE